MSGWAQMKYQTTNWSAYNEALKRRGSLTVWFDPEMVWKPPPSGRRGRQPSLNMPDDEGIVRYAPEADDRVRAKPLALGLAGLDSAGLQHPVPSPAEAEREHPKPWRRGTPLNLFVDSAGIKAEGEGEWNARKHGGPKRRLCRKVHIGIDEETLEVGAVEVTGSNIGDAPILPDLLDQIPAGEEIGSVTADGAYGTRKCREAIAARNAAAVIPPRKNAKPWKPTSPGAVARNEAMPSSQYLGRAIWRRWSGYHRRSRVESKMNCIKLLGQSLMARAFERQLAEL